VANIGSWTFSPWSAPAVSLGAAWSSRSATVYDYANQRTLEVVGDVDAPEQAVVQEFARQPLPSSEEFELAVNLLRQDPEWAELVGEDVTLIPHVPPVVALEQPDGRMHRAIGVVLAPLEGQVGFRVAALDIWRREIHRIDPRGGAEGNCGFPPAGQPTGAQHAGPGLGNGRLSERLR
jgi:hypothetical protein